ncbi:hypothetical protein Tco_1400989 [Tanacetum coccineum]
MFYPNHSKGRLRKGTVAYLVCLGWFSRFVRRFADDMQYSYPNLYPKPSEVTSRNLMRTEGHDQAVPLDGLHFDDKLQFVEEPVEIMDEVKRLRKIHVPIVKVRWNSRRGPEFTWEQEDQFKKKYPHLFTKTAPSSSATL